MTRETGCWLRCRGESAPQSAIRTFLFDGAEKNSWLYRGAYGPRRSESNACRPCAGSGPVTLRFLARRQGRSNSQDLLDRVGGIPVVPGRSAAINYEEVRSMADRALGEAKRAGKNRAIGVFPVGAPTAVIKEPELLVSRIPVEKLCTVGPVIP